MTKKILDRTYPIGQAAVMGVANIGSGNGISFAVPMGAILVRAIVLTTTGFNPGGTGTATLTLSDGTTTFANAVDVESTGSETVANTPKYYPTGGTVTATIAEVVDTTASTTGEVFVYIEYVRPGNGIAGIQE